MKSLSELKKHTHAYYSEHGRHHLSWRINVSPYSVFLSEVMLQQTQVGRVQSKYAEFIATLPDFEVLAAAPQSEVLRLWQGLGYNRRALWLKAAAKTVVEDYGGELPTDATELRKLPGIGPNTAGSVAAFAYNVPTVFIETNIRRVFLHHCFADQEGVADAEILPLIEQALVGEQPREWYWALMDYGSYLATQLPNPNRRSKHYAKQSKFGGSDRQIRGEVLRILLNGSIASQDLYSSLEHLETDTQRVDGIISSLIAEGFIVATKDHYRLG